MNKFKKLFNKYKIDGYIVPKNDEYFNEYIPAHKDRLKFISNFSGSAGFAILFKNKNYLFVDGRYTTQARIQSGKKFKIETIPKRFPKNVLKPNFNWSCEDISNLKSIYKLEKYIILFPFSSAHLTIKRWPFYNELIQKIKEKFENKYQIVVAPGPNEIKIASEIDAKIILNNERALNISQLSTLIKDSSFVIANDTGPAHMAAHLNAKGLVLFGSHTTAKKVSIERENFKAIQVSDLSKLSADKVFQRMQEAIN